MPEIQCARCGKQGERLPFAPFRNELGQRIHDQICQTCWAEWLKHQTMLINHYGLNLQDPEARKFLTENTDRFLFKTGEAEQVDVSKQGTIQW
jgi:Fe-S cluster biosynthesis and repair protein YggX